MGLFKLNKEKIGRRLLLLRGKRSRNQVSKDLGISVSTLQMYENGKRIPKDELKIKIASYYNQTVGDIFYQ